MVRDLVEVPHRQFSESGGKRGRDEELTIQQVASQRGAGERERERERERE